MPSQNVRVLEYRQILLWPFQLKAAIGSNPVDPASLQRAAARILGDEGWQKIDELLEHIPRPDGRGIEDYRQEQYQEYIYFHPFVRQFLFSRKKSSEGILLYQNAKLIGLDVKFTPKDFSISFRVDRANIYLFDVGLAVLALEIVNSDGIILDGQKADLFLKQALTVQDKLRHAYPPYWSRGVADKMPSDVKWRQKGQSGTGADPSPPERKELIDETLQTGEPSLAGHWKQLLGSLLSSGNNTVRLCQVVDERIPSMFFLQVDDPSAISAGDWMRLAMCDGPSDSALPYDARFLADFEQKHCYDRHWHRADNGKADPARASRFLFSGYGFTAVIGQDNGFTGILQGHFRRHYFQMGLLAQFEHAALLAESQRLADADSKSVGQVLKRLLDFTQKYWFVDISNHVQARELYALWRGHLNTEALYRQVLDEVRTVSDFNDMQDNRKTATATTRLSYAAVILAIPSLVFGFLGINLIDLGGKNLIGWPDSLWWWFGIPFGVAGTLALLIVLFICRAKLKEVALVAWRRVKC